MHIFIDESGPFALASATRAVSLVAALTIPDGRLADLEKRYAILRPSLLKDSDEVKGRDLSETEVASVVDLLITEEALYEATAIDMSIHCAADIEAHRSAQADAMMRHLTNEHAPTIHAGVGRFRDRLNAMPLQLYVQSVVTFALIERVIQHGTLYFCQRAPRELGAFNWVIDAKNRDRITEWEDWWAFVIRPFLQSKSLREPMVMLIGGDYSYFARYSTRLPGYLKAHIKGSIGSDEGTDLTKLLTDSFRFSSAAEPGLEMIDILANATRRALMGHLGVAGWANVPRLMIHQEQHYIQVVALCNAVPDDRTWPYLEVLHLFSRGGRGMFNHS